MRWKKHRSSQAFEAKVGPLLWLHTFRSTESGKWVVRVNGDQVGRADTPEAAKALAEREAMRLLRETMKAAGLSREAHAEGINKT